jgi:hypothetical protein
MNEINGRSVESREDAGFALLAAIIGDNDKYHVIECLVRPEDFDAELRPTYEWLGREIRKGRRVNLLSLKEAGVIPERILLAVAMSLVRVDDLGDLANQLRAWRMTEGDPHNVGVWLGIGRARREIEDALDAALQDPWLFGDNGEAMVAEIICMLVDLSMLANIINKPDDYSPDPPE